MLVALFLDKPMFHPKIAPQTLPQIVFGSCRTLIQYHNSCVATPCSTKLHRSINTSPCINICMNININIYIYLYKSLYYINIYKYTSKSKLISLPNPDFSSLFTCIIYKKTGRFPVAVGFFPGQKCFEEHLRRPGLSWSCSALDCNNKPTTSLWPRARRNKAQSSIPRNSKCA